MLARETRWTFGDPETLVYLAAVLIGVPLTMWELWHTGRTNVVAALAALWAATVAGLMFDWVKARITMVSVFFFFAWVAVAIGVGIYNYVV